MDSLPNVFGSMADFLCVFYKKKYNVIVCGVWQMMTRLEPLRVFNALYALQA